MPCNPNGETEMWLPLPDLVFDVLYDFGGNRLEIAPRAGLHQRVRQVGVNVLVVGPYQ